MRAAFYCRIGGQGYGFLLPEEADKLREFFAEHQDKPALEKPSSASKIFCRELDIRVAEVVEANLGQSRSLQHSVEHIQHTIRGDWPSIGGWEHILDFSPYFLSLLFQDFYRISSDGHGAVGVFRF